MKNRAKCKLCGDIIESFHQHDFVHCRCGEIAVDGGEGLRCIAKNWENFLRVDDDGNIIVPKVQEPPNGWYASKWDENNDPIPSRKPTKQELFKHLDDMRESIEKLPQGAMVQPVTHYDLLSLLLLLSSIFRAED